MNITVARLSSGQLMLGFGADGHQREQRRRWKGHQLLQVHVKEALLVGC